MQILVCEDRDSIRQMIETLVESAGHDVIGTNSSAKAVELALNQKFDVVLLDLLLPGMGGFEVCRRLRAEEAMREMPIFIISAMDDPDSRQRAADAGATRFYGMPLKPIELIEDINKIAQKLKA